MEVLKTYLDSKGITQRQFADQLGVSQPTVSDWLNGHQLPSGKRLRAIAEKTGLPVGELLGVKLKRR